MIKDLNEKSKKGVSKVSGQIIGNNMLTELRKAIMAEKVFQIMFGGKKDPTKPELSNIFLNKMVNINDTILPAWEFRYSSETVGGAELEMTGFINSRIFLPNSLGGDLDFQRLIAQTVVRFFNGNKRLDDYLRNVSGLIELGENLEINYDLLFVHGGAKTPVIEMGISYMFDMHRFRIENPEIDFDREMDAPLLKEISTRLQIKGDDNVTGERVNLSPENSV